MRINNKKQVVNLTITTTAGIVYIYFSTEWEYIQYNKNFIFIKFVAEYSKAGILYNKDQVVSIEFE